MIVNEGSESGYFFFSDNLPRVAEYCEYLGFTCCNAIEQVIINHRHGLYDGGSMLDDIGHMRQDLEPIMGDAYSEEFVSEDLWYLYYLLRDHCWEENEGCPRYRSVSICPGHVSFTFEWNTNYGLPRQPK